MEQQQILQQMEHQQLIGRDGIALEYLGSGYDVCGEYANGVSIKRKIFDLDRVPKKDIRQLPNRTADFFSVTGKSVEEYQSSLTVKAGIKASYGLFSGSVEASFHSTDLSINESSYVSIELCSRYETWKLQTTSFEYMYPDVLEDFDSRDGKWLIEVYGGGVLMGMDLGGRWVDNLVVSKLYTNSTTKVSVAMEAAYSSFVSGHSSTEISETVKREKSIASRRVNVIGGDPAFAPGKLEDWQASVEKNPAFMDFTTDGLLMIWELFPQHEDKLKRGFNEYLKEHKLNIKKIRVAEGFFIEGRKYASDRGSGANQDLSLYKPTTSRSYKYVGVNGNSNTVLVLKEASDRYGALQEPLDWQPVWNDRGSSNSSDYNVWIPVGPPEFVALGVYCRFGVPHQNPPSAEEAKDLVMVHRSLVEETGIETDVWTDRGSGSDHDLSFGRLRHKALWPYRTTDPEAGELPSPQTLKKEYIKT